ncbi:MAG: hypothetical protein ACQERS_04015 [Bacteroidota bacterium]
MKKLIILLAITLISITASSQALEFNLRGGVNFQGSHSPDKKASILPHMGLMTGMQISNIGIYAEVLFSIHDDPEWAERASYFVPSVLARYFVIKNIYVEGGITYYILAEEQIEGSAVDFPDKKVGFMAGGGLSAGPFDLGLRGNLPVKSIQATASYRFGKRR